MQLCCSKLQLPSGAEELHGVPHNDRAYSYLLGWELFLPAQTVTCTNMTVQKAEEEIQAA